MLAYIVLLALVTGGLSAVLCPTRVYPQRTVHLPHPTSCSKFLTCVGNHPVEQDCPAGLYWNIEQAFCDYPGVSGCSRGEHAQQLEKQLFNSTAVVNSICLPQFDRCPLNSNPTEQMIFVKHQDCRKFYACAQTHQVELSCPPNLYWNSQGCVCDYEVEAECIEMKRPNDDVPVIDEEPIEPENGEDQEPVDEPEQSGDEDTEPEIAPDQEPEPEENNKPDDADAHEPAEEPEQNADEVPEGDGPIARVRRAVDGDDPSGSGGSSGSESSGGESSGSGSSGSGSSGSESSGGESSGGESSGSGSSGSGSSGGGSSGSGSSGGGSSGAPVESGADVKTASSIAIIAFTAVMSLL
ncbi:clumping factor B-like [Armigeres subalbatus]|uniref:clumping factor B-like n=1 Tax=Armigeres subalbatus TaxID=124917 RepID=UPI002ED06667